MDIIERLDAAIKTEDFWVGDQREDNILKDSKKIIEQLREALRRAGNKVEPLASFQQKDIGSSTIRVGEETKFSRDARSDRDT